MAETYKVLGQGVNTLKVDSPANGSTIISELKIKNISYPTKIDIMHSDKITLSSTPSNLPLLSSANAFFYNIILQQDKKILISGPFTNVNGVSKTQIARLNADGSIDTSFNITLPLAGNSQLLDLTNNGNIFIYDGNKIVKLKNNGQQDTTFLVSNTLPAATYYVSGQIDEKIFVESSTYNQQTGTTSYTLNRLNADGSVDNTFIPKKSTQSYYGFISKIAVQQDGKIVVSQRNSVNTFILYRLNADGTKDTSFNDFNFNYSVENVVNKIIIQNDGKILLLGELANSYSSLGASNLGMFRLNSDGTQDTSFNNVMVNDEIVNAQILDDGSVIIVGRFSRVNGITRSAIAKVDTYGNLDSEFIYNIGQTISAIGLDSIGNAYIGTYGSAQVSPDNFISKYIMKISQAYTCDNAGYIAKGLSLDSDQEVLISGGLVVGPNESLVVDSTTYYPDSVIIHAYGTEVS